VFLKKINPIVKRLANSGTYWQSLANYAERGWGLLYSVILARVILPETFGDYALGVSIATLSALLTRWEIGNLVRVDSYYQGEGFGVAWAMTKRLVNIEVLVVSVVTIACQYIGLSSEICCVIFVTGLFNAFDKYSNLLRCDLEAHMKFKQNFRVKVIFTPVAAAITIPMGLLGFGIWALLSSAWVGTLINWVVYRKANAREIPTSHVDSQALRALVNKSFWQWLCFCSQTMFARLDKLAMGAIGSSSDVGYYNRSFNYAPLSFLGLAALAGGPAIVAFRRFENAVESWKYFWRRSVVLVGSGVLFGLLWLFWGEGLVGLLFGQNWLPAVPYFKAFAFFGAIQGFYYLVCAYMQGRLRYRAQAAISLVSIGSSALFGLFFVRNGLGLVYLVQATMISAALIMLMFLKFKESEMYVKDDSL